MRPPVISQTLLGTGEVIDTEHTGYRMLTSEDVRSVWRTRHSQPPLIWRSAIPARLVHAGPHRKESQRFVQRGSSTHEASPPG